MTILILHTTKHEEPRCILAAQDIPCSIRKNLVELLVWMNAAEFDD